MKNKKQLQVKKHHLIILLLLLFFQICAYGQTDSLKQKGVVYFKLKDTSTISLQYYDTTYSGTYPYLQSIIDFYEITEIYNSFGFLNHSYFNKVYRIRYNDYHHGNQIIDDLENLNFVEFAEFKTKNTSILTTNDTIENIIWHIKDMKLDKAFNLTNGDTNIIIAIVDGPINTDITDLQGKFWKNTGETPNDNIDNDGNGLIDDFNGWDFAMNDKNPFWEWTNTSKMVFDKFDHGTAVATLAAGRINNPNSTAGACPGCKLMPIKVHVTSQYDTIITRDVDLFGEYEGLTYAAKSGAKIINVSWGGYSLSFDAISKAALDYADSLGAIVVAGSGNDNNKGSIFGFDRVNFYPANYSKVISVGALKMDKYKTSFSNYYPATKVDIMAPGDNLLCGKLWGTSNYELSAGTSLSAPLVSGVLGLMYSINPGLSKTAIKSCLFNSCDSIDYKNFEYRGLLGNGSINALKAVNCTTTGYTADFYTEKLEQMACVDSNVLFYTVNIPNGLYKWIWGDGSTSITNNNVISKTYTTPGIYTITLIASDTLSFITDTITKEKWFISVPCKMSETDYSKNWFLGTGNHIEFKNGKAEAYTNNSISTYAQVGIHTPLDDDSSYLFFWKQQIDQNSSSYLFKNKSRFLNNSNRFDTTYSGNQNNFNQNLPGVILPDFNSDSLLILTFPSYVLVNANKSSNFLYSMSRQGGVSSQRIAPLATGAEDSISNGFLKTTELGCVIPSPTEKVYWLLTHPTGANGNRIYIYKLSPSNTGLNREFKYNGEFILPSGYLTEICISPSGNFLALHNDTMLYLYDFDALNGTVTYLQKIPGFFNFGTCFSHNDKTLFTTEKSGDILGLYQYDLSSNNISNSKKTITTGISEYFNGLQLGPDSIIYLNGGYKGYLGAIGYPEILNTQNYSNECGYVMYAKDLNTITPRINRDSGQHSALKLPGFVFQNIPKTVEMNLHPYKCDSGYITSNFPVRIFQKWIVNDKLYFGSNPIVEMNRAGNNTIKLLVDSASWSFNSLQSDSANPPLPIINNGSSVFHFALGPPVKLHVTNKYYRGFSFIQWYKDGVFVDSTNQLDTFYVTIPGVYHAVGVTPCGISVSKPVGVFWDCSANQINNTFKNDTGIVVSGVTTISNGIFNLSGNNRILAGGTLNINRAGLSMAPGSKITVNKGGRLLIDSTYIRGCGRWQGIEVLGEPNDSNSRYMNSTVHGNAQITNSTIADALIGVKTNNGGFLLMANDTLINNGIHVLNNHYNYRDKSIITLSVFKMLAKLSGDSLNNQTVSDSIFLNELNYRRRSQCILDSVNEVTYSNNEFWNQSFLSESDHGLAEHSVFSNKCNLLTFNSNIFEVARNNSTLAVVNGNNMSITNNSISKQANYGGLINSDYPITRGMWLKNVTGSTIQNNYIENQYEGIGYYTNTSSPVAITWVKENNFVNNNTALAVATDTFPLKLNTAINNLTNTIYLKTECNSFSGDSTAFVACGKILPQGTSSIAVGNKFYNVDDTCVWFNNNSLIHYYSIDTMFGFAEEPFFGQHRTLSFPVLINGTTITVTDCEKISLPYPNCTSVPAYNTLNSNVTANKWNLIVRPNPSQNGFELISNIENYTYTILNIAGEKVESNMGGLDRVVGNTLSSGVYILRVIAINGNISKSLKIIKL